MKIHLGCGPKIKAGWINIDLEGSQFADSYTQLIRHDLLKGLPSQDFHNKPLVNIEEIYSEHFWEHLTPDQGFKLMQECLICMAPGGKFRIALPNFRSMIKAILDYNWEFFNLPGVIDFAPNKQIMEIANFGVYQYENGLNEHKCMYDPEYCIFMMSRAGFKDCKELPFDNDYDSPEESRRRYTFYCEGLA